MSEVDQLINLINSILQSEDKATREAAEQTLVGLRGTNPNQLMLAFLIILAGKIRSQLRPVPGLSEELLGFAAEAELVGVLALDLHQLVAQPDPRNPGAHQD